MGEFEDETVAEPAAAQPAATGPAAGEQEPAAEPTSEPTTEQESAPAEAESDVATGDVPDDGGEPGPSDGAETPAVVDEDEASDDDLAAAIAASSEQVGTEATLDDIVPGTTHVVAAEEPAPDADAQFGAPWWPFLAYLGLWLVFAGVAIWQFQQLPAGTVIYETQHYTLFVFGGLALAAIGVFLIPAVWLGSRTNLNRQRVGLFSSALIKGAGFILVGMVVWWGTFMALDYLRLGRLI